MRIPSSQRASRAEFWARLRRSLWQPPRPHGEQPRERVVGPLELFYDLAVVVLVAQAAHHLAEHLTWPGLGEFAAVFTLVWIAWANGFAGQRRLRPEPVPTVQWATRPSAAYGRCRRDPPGVEVSGLGLV